MSAWQTLTQDWRCSKFADHQCCFCGKNWNRYKFAVFTCELCHDQNFYCIRCGSIRHEIMSHKFDYNLKDNPFIQDQMKVRFHCTIV